MPLPGGINFVLLTASIVFVGFFVFRWHIFGALASDMTADFTFGVSEDYSLSDSNQIEISTNSAQLKTREHEADASTELLYSMNEGIGTEAVDLSGKGNDGTIVDGTWGSGIMNGGLGFNGLTSKITIPDSTSLSLSQASTIEAWTKFSDAFAPGSHPNRQGIVDKGDYQLYFDSETGKLIYELKRSSASDWTKRAGDALTWSNGVFSVNVLVKSGSTLYAGMGTYSNNAQVWKFDGTSWTMIGGSSIVGSWGSDYESVRSLLVDGSDLYVGLGDGYQDDEVWKWNGSSWQKIGGDTVNSSWTGSYGVYSLVKHNGKIYAGTYGQGNSTEVWEWNGTNAWVKRGGGSSALNGSWINATAYGILSMVSDGTNLYVGTGTSSSQGDVWRWNGSTWTQIGGDGINGGWASNKYERVNSIVWDGTYLYAGMGDNSTWMGSYSEYDSDVWRWDGSNSTWVQFGGDGVNGSWNNPATRIGGLAHYDGHLYAGLYGGGSYDGEVWRYEGEVGARLSNPYATVIAGNYAYTASYGSSALEITDISNPTSPTHVGSLLSGAGGAVMVNPTAVAVSGNYAYVVSEGSDALEIIDIADPANPTHVGSLINGAGGALLNNPYGIAISGNYAYIAAYSSNALEVVNISNPAAPVHTSANTNTYMNAAVAVAISGNYAYVASLGYYVIAVIDISNPANTTYLRYFNSNTSGVRAITVAGGYMYAASIYGNNLEIADISNPSSPVHAGYIGNGSNGAMLTNPRWVAVAGNYAYVVSDGSDALEIVNISNPAAPTHSAALQNGAGGAMLMDPVGIAVSGDYAYIASFGSSALEVVNISNPAAPTHSAALQNGAGWTKIGGDGVSGSWTMSSVYINSLVVDASGVYTGSYTGQQNSGQVWKMSGASWQKIGGDYTNLSWGYFGLDAVMAIEEYKEDLIFATGTSIGDAALWKYDGSTTTFFAGNNWNGSWLPDTYERIISMESIGDNLYVGLGTTAEDADVWRWNGISWAQIGGDFRNSGWGTGFEEVISMAEYQGKLVVGLGISNNDAEVWEWDGAAWRLIGGDSQNGGWTTNVSSADSMVADGDYLYVGTGRGTAYSDIWRWNGTSWNQVGGDGINGGWGSGTGYEKIESLAFYDGKLYAGMGYSNGDADIWSFDGTTWVQIGGNGLNGSWSDTGVYNVRTMAVYNGELYAGLGYGTSNGDVWKWSGSVWTKVAGEDVNRGWDTNIEEVHTLHPYKGKLYAGIGNTANSDAELWSFGDNAYLQSNTVGQDTDWHHIAATYDGATMKLYIDGVLDASRNDATFINDSDRKLYIGTTYGSAYGGVGYGSFAGSLDEVRISSTARIQFVTSPYASTQQAVRPNTAAFTSGVSGYDAFSSTDEGVGIIAFRLSDDGGSTWKYWYEGAWTISSSLIQTNTEADIQANITSFPLTRDGIMWQGVLLGDGFEQTTLTSVSIGALRDIDPPTNPTSVAAMDQAGGSILLAEEPWYPYSAPEFSWSGASRGTGSDIDGYFVYFGPDDTGVPSTAGQFQTGNTFTPPPMTSGETYYLRIQTRDIAQNVQSEIFPAFEYKFDNTPPENPGVVSVSPSSFTNVNQYTFFWPSSGNQAAHDDESNLAGFQYKTGASSGPLSEWSAITTETNLEIIDAAYQEGPNSFYLRTVDNAGNVSASEKQVIYFFSGAAPTNPRDLVVDREINTENAFSFSWNPPDAFSGDEIGLSYCYTVNVFPQEGTCNWTQAGVTTLPIDAYANLPGKNTLRIVARDATDNVNYEAYAWVYFTANTSAPGIPRSLDIADVSVKATSSWKLAVSWDEPEYVGAGVSTYKVYHSTDGVSFTEKSSIAGTAFVDTKLTQQVHYYKIKACDSVNNCGALSGIVSLYPDGKFTVPPEIVSTPKIDSVTTKKATISWSTDRASDSKVQYGKKSDEYFEEEPSNSEQITDHVINLTNLSPDTKYYFRTKWTDEDGNTGTSEEYSFITEPPPTIRNVSVKNIGLSSAFVQFSAEGASKVKVYFGKSTGFGGVLEMTTGLAEGDYTAEITGLDDGTKYYYKINGFDAEDEEYEGTVLDFATVPRPKISNVRIQQARGTAQPTVLVTWETNTETSSVVNFYPESDSVGAQDEVDPEFIAGEHKMIIRELMPQTQYVLAVRSRDRTGNEATSDSQRFTTATDTRPPQIIEMNIEGSSVPSVSKDNQEAVTQLVVSWNTDELATSQVEFGEGTGSFYPQKTQQESNLTTNHLVVISGLTPSKVYHLRALSKDSAGNERASIDSVTITPKVTESAFNLVIANLRQIFGFLQ